MSLQASLHRGCRATSRGAPPATAIQAQVAEIGINRMDFTLYANDEAKSRLLGAPCTSCTPEPWSVETKNMDG